MIVRRPACVHVCALRHIPDVLDRTGARHLVSAINADLAPETPKAVAPDNHLKLDMHDITEAQLGSVAPALEHVSDLLDFVLSWDRETPLLIHCYAGLSRSTAAAFITLCALNPLAQESAIARALRGASDTAVPNRLFVSQADALLRRDGRMVTALASMGAHRPAAECVPFGLDSQYAESVGKAPSRAA